MTMRLAYGKVGDMPVKELMDNPRADRVRHLVALANSSKHDEFVLVEGPQSVREAVRYAATAIRDVYVRADLCEQSSGENTIASILQSAVTSGCYVHPMSRAVLQKITSDSQGIFAVLDAKQLEDAAAEAFNKLALASQSGNRLLRIAACYQVRDPGNAGAIIRVADVAGCDGVVFVDDCVSRWNTKVVRSTAGSLFHVPTVTMTSQEWFAWAHQAGVRVVAADIYGTPSHQPVQLPQLLNDSTSSLLSQSYAILFGNEARGLPQEVLETVDAIAMIPIYGKAESMNLATSAAVMLMVLAMSSHERTINFGKLIG